MVTFCQDCKTTVAAGRLTIYRNGVWVGNKDLCKPCLRALPAPWEKTTKRKVKK